MNIPKIMIADDDEKILFAFNELFRRDNYSGIIAKNGEEALEQVSSRNPDVIFLDITMPKLNGLEVLEEIKKKQPHTPVIIITGYGTMRTAVKAIQLGAFEYLTKPLDLKKIREVIGKALEGIAGNGEPAEEQIKFNTDIPERYELLGTSPQMMEVYKLIGSISITPNTTSVLIIGESGTGKELVARAIHNNSSAPGNPFIAINCAAFPETLLESELFGYEKGAFTGAQDRKLGKFEVAQSGTIFLDEIANMSLNLQQKLLRVLQNREFERVGSNELIPVQARFIAASNVELAGEMKKGNFREDLYYRLNVANVHLTPLRERKEDIPLLANYFIAKYNYNLKKNVKGLSEETLTMLLSYYFPGNVRELQNLIERAVMLAKTRIILPDSISELFMHKESRHFKFPIISTNFSEARNYIFNEFEKEFVTELLKRNSGNVTRAARASNMTRQNFQRIMKKHSLQAGEFRQ